LRDLLLSSSEPLTNDVILAIPTISLPHRDPADALLAATARVVVTLDTADAGLFGLKKMSVSVDC
jgi:hypothetical protein